MMTKKEELKWRLGSLPTPLEVQELVKGEIITKEEARDILFSSERDREEKSLKAEIKFLREIVEKLTDSKSRVIEVIREVEKPFKKWDWYQPYGIWCSSVPSYNATTSDLIGNGTVTVSAGTNGNYLNAVTTTTDSKPERFADSFPFNEIHTF